jgi:hypothetical protein
MPLEQGRQSGQSFVKPLRRFVVPAACAEAHAENGQRLGQVGQEGIRARGGQLPAQAQGFLGAGQGLLPPA